VIHRLSSVCRGAHNSCLDNVCGDIAARLPSGLDKRPEVLYNTFSTQYRDAARPEGAVIVVRKYITEWLVVT
jgi:hypothetical protein